MLALSDLRLAGLLVAIACLIGFGRLLRQSDANPAAVLSLGGTGIGLMVVAIFPGTAGVLTDLLSIGRFQGSRLLALAVVAVLVLWLAVIFLLARSRRTAEQLDRLIRHVAVDTLSPEDRARAQDAIVAVIPAYNEADNVGHVLDRLLPEIDGQKVVAVVVDDGSDDGTAAVARRHGAIVIRNPFRRGGGAAIRAGFDAAIAVSADVAVTLDADGQNDPQEMPGLVRPILEDRADIVLGSRILGRHEITVWWRHVGVLLFSRLLNLLMGTRITDVSTGYRAVRVRALERLALRQDQYHTSEFLVLAAKARLRIAEAPIVFKRRLSGKSKKGNELLYGFRFAYVLLTSWLRTR